jgi:hypothetical protein
VVLAATAPSLQVSNPGFGYQFFGEVTIDRGSQAMTVRLRDIDGAILHTIELASPRGDPEPPMRRGSTTRSGRSPRPLFSVASAAGS